MSVLSKLISLDLPTYLNPLVAIPTLALELKLKPLQIAHFPNPPWLYFTSEHRVAKK